jgi:hypothetical protein
MKNCKVKCDEAGCDWIQDCSQESIPDWHRKPCPKCGKGEIINDEELAFFIVLSGAEKYCEKVFPDELAKSGFIQIDSGLLRKSP